ncbi:ATP-binding cassette domain-containing protein [Lapillicoccus sp.]|uniref:ABC transporter ATP-binding protein n=1 Tax=Lapillicoccus sp. TaxID=1909287 RepID=UPI0025F012BC|nr:ATP-binding cassette domain-containing protein [Lapillicoccus sp.]
MAARARIAIVGPSGSGKSTLLHLMAGLEIPTGGTVEWPGLDAGAADRARQIGVVFQGPTLVPALDVLENASLPLVLAGVPAKECRSRALEALRLVGVEALVHQLPEELSGGQAQRVALARVLAQGPHLVLADEPTGQLDAVAGRQVIDELLLAADRLGAALVVSTHDALVAERLDERWTMHEGRLSAAAEGRVPA